MAMSKYETIMWEEKMKERILSHARILYAEKLTPTSILDIVSTQFYVHYGYNYTSYIIMTDTPRSTECKVLVTFPSSSSSLGDRLETLLKSLSERLAPRMINLAQQAGNDTVFIEEGYY